jgi:hypothetical protein
MASKPKTNRVTFEILRAETLHDTHKLGLTEEEKAGIFKRIDDMEAKVIQLIQLRDEEKALKEKIGYTDWDGTKHPGLSDEIEKLFVKYNLYDGVKVEDFNVSIVCGSAPDWIDKIELLRLGVTEDVIQRATRVGKGWTAVRCQRIQSKDRKKKP